MPKFTQDSLPVIDLLAGPGGLGEGFAAFRPADRMFMIQPAVDKDLHVHRLGTGTVNEHK